jgi:asparagine N-glycosylation enzyme membrane subunit Stt3
LNRTTLLRRVEWSLLAVAAVAAPLTAWLAAAYVWGVLAVVALALVLGALEVWARRRGGR